MGRQYSLLIAVGLLAAPLATVSDAIPAFPGAEGPGAVSTGGRPNQFGGGIVYHVTTLAADHPTEPTIVGSLRYGLKNERFLDSFGRIIPRTIVFDVGGTIDLNNVDWDFRVTNVTFAGQTAPSGINLLNGEFNPGGDNSIMRNFSVRRGGDTVNEKDAMWLNGTNTIVDHVTASWQTDEGISVTDGQNNVTVQYSIIAEGISHADGGDGSSIEGRTPNAKSSFHHNLYAHNKSRLPRRGEKEGPGDILDFRNNVIYNWSASSAGTSPDSDPDDTDLPNEASFTNFVNNYYIRGVNNGQNVMNTAGSLTNGSLAEIYQSGNLRDINRNGIADGVLGGNGGWDYFLGNEEQLSTPLSLTHNVTQSPEAALQTVLDYSGPNWWSRDSVVDTVDERIIKSVKTYGNTSAPVSEKGQVITSVPTAEWNALIALATNPAPFSRPLDWDTESMGFYPDPDGTGPMTAPPAPQGDGMPSWWEVLHGLDPNVDDHNGDFDNDGYRNLEEYINDIATWPAPFDIVFTGGTNSRFAQITNWSITQPSPGESPTTTNWQPSKFDVAVINNGTAAVDAVGQHAGTVKLGTNPGDNATLNITAGWLKVEDVTIDDQDVGPGEGDVVIGAHAGATATLNLSGGRLITETLSRGLGGEFNFTGGVLSAGTVEFDLENNGGTIAPGNSVGETHVMGNLELGDTATLEIELESDTLADFIEVDDAVTLDGTLNVVLLEGFTPDENDSWLILSAASIDGQFDSITEGYSVEQIGGDLYLQLASTVLVGDYNGDGKVSAADFTVWRDSLGAETLTNRDPNNTGPVGTDDFNSWKDNYGAIQEEGLAAGSAVPEPATIFLAFIGYLVALGVSAKMGRE